MKKFEIKSTIHKESLELIYKLIMVVSLVSLVTNALNHRPLIIFMLSISSFLVVYICYFLSSKRDQKYVSKIIFLTYFGIIYIPFAWLTSPGSLSAMPLFSLFVLIISILFIERNKELIFTFIIIIETLGLFILEYQQVIQLETFPSEQVRLMDVSINYLFISASLTVILYRIVRYYLEQHERVYLKSVVDDLTGVYNRRFLMKVLISEDSYLINEIDYYTVIMIDINNFKEVNDVYGHLEGDEVLKALGSILLKNTRKYDICSRYGGDEFLVILPEATKKDAMHFINRVSKSFDGYTKKFRAVDFSLAFGLANSKEKSVKEIIDLADQNLYQNKREK